MRKKVFSILFLLVAFCYNFSFAQTSTVTGRVTGADGQPIAGATITASGSKVASVSDTEGNFSIAVGANGSITVSAVGFTTQVVKVGNSASIAVRLEIADAKLDEVVVTGYTTQKKKDILGSVAVVDVKALKSAPSSSAMQALQGQAAGVEITNNGSPGASSLIFIRGITGFANAPLVLIDGVQGNINDVPAPDVESIQVLKDAGAASIYGARGSNGVIVITTKKGKSGAPAITYDSYYNFLIPYKGSKLNTINAQQYADILNAISPGSAVLNASGELPDYYYRGPSGQGSGAEGDATVNPDLYKFDLTNRTQNYIIAKVNKNAQGGDMYDAIFRNALMMNHNVTASGGTDRATYLFSLGYLDQQGTLQSTYLKRYNIRINSTFKIGKYIRVGENVNLQFKENPQMSSNGGFGPIQQAASQLPFLPIYDVGGNFAGPYSGPANFGLGDWGNAKADVTLTGNNRNRNFGTIGNIFMEVDIAKHFTARTSLGGAITNYYNQAYTYTKYWTASGGGNQTLQEVSGFATTLQWTNTLSYKNQIGKHNITALVGTESLENNARQLVASGEKFLSDDYNYLVLGNAQITRIPSSGASEDALFSLMGRVDYNYDEKYLLGFTVRRDGYSAFGPSKKYGVFPAGSIGWRLSRESFMENVSFVNDLKIRASYGILGSKESISPYNSYTTFAQGPRYSYYDINGTGNSAVQGFYPAQNGNAFTSWEQDKLLNIGIDATILKNSLDFSIEYYKKTINGLLRRIQAPYTAGEAVSPFVNFGDVENKGVDININYRGKISKDFTYNVGVNFTTYKNKILKLESPGYADEGIVRFEEGHPMSSFFGYKVIGVFQDSNQVKSMPVQQDAAPGRYMYLDRDGNDTINSLDRVHFGDPNPDFIIGINLGASYKNFDFSAIIYTTQGNDIYNNQLEWLGSFERGISNKSTRVLNAWTPQNTNTNIKKNELGRNFSNSGVNNSDFMEDGSFWRLRSVQLGYTMPSSMLKSIGLTKLRVYVTGINLLTITKYSGIDPEVSGTGVGFRGQDAGAYVQDKGVAFGLNIGF